MKGLPWSTYFERILGDISVANAVIDIWDTDGISEQLKINSEWWDYYIKGKIKF